MDISKMMSAKRSLHSELTEVVSALIDAHWRLREIGDDHKTLAIASAPLHMAYWTPQDAELHRERDTLERELGRALDHVSEKTKDDAIWFRDTNFRDDRGRRRTE